MTITVLRCGDCGAEWVSNVSRIAIEEHGGRCLRCNGPLSEVELGSEPSGDGAGDGGGGGSE